VGYGARVGVIVVPYHLDEYLPDLDVPVPAQAVEAAGVVTAEPAQAALWDRLAELYRPVAAVLADRVRGGDRPVVVSGDCTTALGTLAGLQQGGVDPAVVWFDAHGDVQTLETTTSGYAGGLPLRIVAGYRPELIAAGIGLTAVAEDRIVLVGARDLDPPEAEYLDASAIGRCEVGEVAADLLPAGPLYLHVDLDVVDPDLLPGLRFPAAGGPDPALLAAALARVLGTGRVAALGLACTWHPGRGAADRLREHLAPLLAPLLAAG
jgi:arginase